MAEVSFKVDKGPKGGYLAYISIASPVLGKKSSQWHLVVPEDQPDNSAYEYPTIISAENAARRRALQLNEKVEQMEQTAGIKKSPVSRSKGKRGGFK